MNWSPGAIIPDLDAAIGARRGQLLPIRAEGQSDDPLRMRRQRSHQISRVPIPHRIASLSPADATGRPSRLETAPLTSNWGPRCRTNFADSDAAGTELAKKVAST